MSKFCIDCVHYRIGICDARGIYPYPPDRIPCDKFAPMSTKESCVAKTAEIAKQTVFHRITADEETLSEKLVFPLADGWWMSSIIDDGIRFATREGALAATVAKLKEVAE